jgi:hypothetical protein
LQRRRSKRFDRLRPGVVSIIPSGSGCRSRLSGCRRSDVEGKRTEGK